MKKIRGCSPASLIFKGPGDFCRISEGPSGLTDGFQEVVTLVVF